VPVETDVQLHVYLTTAESGRPPRIDEVAAALSIPADDVRAAFSQLRARRLLFLAPESGEIVMAPPFSAVPTPFAVAAGGRRYFANCVWDSLGIAAALHADAVVEASCGCCGDPIRLEVEGGSVRAETAAGEPLPGADGVRAHFAVPARRWWDDLVYT
jgi:hypothetical protein